jgi:hypothetical protein
MGSSRPRQLTLLLLVALALRVGWGLVQPIDDAAIDRLPDQREYLSLGRNLLHEHALAFVDPRFDQTVYAYRTPGYPAFIALCGGSVRAVRLAQAIIDTATVLAAFLLARQMSGNAGVALMAGAIVAINPFLVYFSGLVLSETLFTAALAWEMVLLSRRMTVAGGIVMLLAVLVRPSAILLAPLLVVPAVYANPPAGSAYRLLGGLRDGLIVLAITMVGLFQWAYRNHRVVGSWVWTTTNAGVTLYDGFHPGATGASDQRFLADLPQLRSMNEVERSRYLSDQASGWAKENTSALPRLTLAKIARTWSPLPLSAEFGRPLYRAISGAYAIPFDALAIAGLFSRRLTRSAKVLLLTPAIYFTIVHALSVGSLRYRMPVEPELAALSAIGAAAIFSGSAQHHGFLPEETNEHPLL